MIFTTTATADAEAVRVFESRWAVRLPQCYSSFLTDQNGGKLDGLYVYDGRWEVKGFFGIDNDLPEYDLTVQYDKIKPLIPKNYLPIALDSGGNFYLMKRNVRHTAVYFWDHNLQAEGSRGPTTSLGMKMIAESFTAFLSGIAVDDTEITVTVTRKDGKIILSRDHIGKPQRTRT